MDISIFRTRKQLRWYLLHYSVSFINLSVFLQLIQHGDADCITLVRKKKNRLWVWLRKKSMPSKR